MREVIAIPEGAHQLPDAVPAVRVKGTIRAQHRQVVREALGNEYPVDRIAVMERQAGDFHQTRSFTR
jgi:hypothetical protein